jgi:flagellar assembly protein FliH
MLCKIANQSLAAEPIAWRVVELENIPLKHAPQVGAPPTGETDARRVDQLERSLSELEGTRQGELARARKSGFDDGIYKGREEAAGEVQKALDQLARNIQDLAQQKRKVRNEAERELVQLSLAVARRILHRELLVDPESIQAIVYAALKKLQNREISRVRVYPAGAAAVRAAMERAGQRNAVEVVSDPSLSAGALLFETVVGELDVSIETQLQEIERGFADRLALP